MSDNVKKLVWTPWPTLPAPDENGVKALLEKNGVEWVFEAWKKREDYIRWKQAEPYHYGDEFPMWKDADRLLDEDGKTEICVLGGNRSSKSHWAAKRLVKAMMKKENAIVWGMSTTEMTCIRDVHRYVWHYLPGHWKQAKKGVISYIKYHKKTGFSDGVFVGPNGSECRFMNYKQDMNVIEGGQADLVWCDENVPLDWLTTLRSRIVDRHGKIIVTFTPIHGFNQTVAEYVNGSRVRQWKEVDLEDLKGLVLWPGGGAGKIPYILDCLGPKQALIFFYSRENAFIDYEELKAQWENKSRKDRLIRLYGITQKTSGNVFPQFGVHNIVKPELIPKDGTNYMFIDFAWNRKWFMLWFRVCENKGYKRVYVYREWPDYPTYGEWVIPSEKPDGARGPAQQTMGWGINQYKALIRELEKGEPIAQRFGDPRSGVSASLAEEGVTSILEMMALGDEKNPPMYVEPVCARGYGNSLITEGVNLINKWLEYNEEKPLSAENCPVLHVSSACQNLIDCLKMWTGEQKESGASKDPIDLLRYAALMDIGPYSADSPVTTGGGSY